MAAPNGPFAGYKARKNEENGSKDKYSKHVSVTGDGVTVAAIDGCKNENNRTSCFPVMFERASVGPLDPRFDSSELEEQLCLSFFPQTRRKFRYALCYVIVCCLLWSINFGIRQAGNWQAHVIGTVLLGLLSAGFLGVTWTVLYSRCCYLFSTAFTLVLCALSLLGFVSTLNPAVAALATSEVVSVGTASEEQRDMSSVGSFSGSVEILLMIYTLIPFPMYGAVAIAIAYSAAYETLLCYSDAFAIEVVDNSAPSFVALVVGKVLLHASVHMLGAYIFLMATVQRHSTFWQIGQSSMARAELNNEKQVQEKMIHSLMPPMVASAVMKQKESNNSHVDSAEDEDGGSDTTSRRRSAPRQQQAGFVFRQFTMYLMDNVSILYADIVGFTKMSSNKTAEHLVLLLNDLFGRFDYLCTKNGCEKISTLGDCYYCVSGCPNASDDHARCCVEMGLDMITAIKEFDEANNEEVNMRVGIHTGKVLCGIVGTRRFKFDVWSHDVELANNMESSGMPGRVHISESTYSFLKSDEYDVQEGEEVDDTRKKKELVENYDPHTMKYRFEHVEEAKNIKTYFIDGRKKERQIGNGMDSHSSREIDRTIVSVSQNNNPALVCAAGLSLDNNSAMTLKDGLRRSSFEGETIELVEANEKENDRGQLMASSLFSHRKTGSETSLSADGDDSNEDSGRTKKSKSRRKQQMSLKKKDLNLVKFIQEDKDSKAYFYQPPINQVTLNFTDSAVEAKYRDRYRRDIVSHGQKSVQTWSAPRLYAFLDLLVATLNFVLLACAAGVVYTSTAVSWLVYLAVVIAILLVAFAVLSRSIFGAVCCPGGKGDVERESSSACGGQRCRGLVAATASWIPLHVFGAILVALPIGLVYTAYPCGIAAVLGGEVSGVAARSQDYFFCYALIAALAQFSNFNMLSSWMKSSLATMAAAIALVLGGVQRSCMLPFTSAPAHGSANRSTAALASTTAQHLPLSAAAANTSAAHSADVVAFVFGGGANHYEWILDHTLLLLFIWLLNRELEILSRVAYHGYLKAQTDCRQMQKEKEQADWLLHNIIPDHVVEHIRHRGKFSQSHADAGVVFASIVNFDEMYDESYEGGKEYLRVLNELFNDYEALFELPAYKDVEKIKTIGSTFMAASGLNPATRLNAHPHAHLYALMDFCIDLLQVVQKFNEGMFSFNFVLKIGFNVGDVVSGVIGTTKLHYDIWGNTVNVASRMYSTGMPARIQVPEETKVLLEDVYDFEYRGEIAVKGKGNMRTWMLVRKKESSTARLSWP